MTAPKEVSLDAAIAPFISERTSSLTEEQMALKAFLSKEDVYARLPTAFS